jgi:hypothetical protein
MGNRLGFGTGERLRIIVSRRRQRSAINSARRQQYQLPDDSARDHGTGHQDDLDMVFDEERLRRESSKE